MSEDKELDLEAIKGKLDKLESDLSDGNYNAPPLAIEYIETLIAEVGRLRTDRDACIEGLKELKDNALTSMRSYPKHSEGWLDFSRRAQAYENAYIRATNMLNWNGSGRSFAHFKDG